MKKTTMLILLAVVLAAIPAASAQAAGEDAGGTTNVQGRVIALEKATQTQNAGASHLVRVRTRDGREMTLDLGPKGPCEGCLRVGDQVRVQAMHEGGEGAPWKVRTMQVRRTGQMMQFRDQNGAPLETPRVGNSGGMGDRLRTHQRDRIHEPGTGGGAGTRQRDRIHTPGTGGGTGAGTRHGGGGRR